MSRVRLDQEVNTDDYGVTTCAALLDSRHAIVEKCDHFGRNDVTKYFVTLLDPSGALTNGCFEIGQKAYESRAAHGFDKLPAADAASVPTLPTIAPPVPSTADAAPASQFSVSGVLYVGQWHEDHYRVTVPYDAMIFMRSALNVIYEQAHESGGSIYDVSYLLKSE